MWHNGQVDAASPANIRPTHFLLPVRYTDSPRVVTQPLQEMLSSALLWNVGAGRRHPGRWWAWKALAEWVRFGKAFAVADKIPTRGGGDSPDDAAKQNSVRCTNSLSTCRNSAGSKVRVEPRGSPGRVLANTCPFPGSQRSERNPDLKAFTFRGWIFLHGIWFVG